MGVVLALRCKKDLNILRLNLEQMDSDENCERLMVYNRNILSMRNFCEGDKVVLIDDVISSGKTIISIVDYLSKIRVTVVGIVAIQSK